MANNKEQYYCTRCQRLTKHDVLHDEHEKHVNEDNTCKWTNYEMIQCMGCENISFYIESIKTRSSDAMSDVMSAKNEYYPRKRATRYPIEGVEKFPEITQKVYKEVLKVIDDETLLLAAIGLRTLIESVCRDQSYTWNNLYEGIEDLSVNEILSFTQVEFLHACRFMGNIAAHKIVAPSRDELLAALDIAETLLKTIYILPGKAQSIDIKRKTDKT